MTIPVAIAGATGKIGRTLVEVLSKNPARKVVALSRKAPENLPSNVTSHVVDYTDVGQLRGILEQHKIQAVISALQVASPESGASEMNLVQAASQSPCTKRFISSDWAMPIRDSALQMPFHAFRNATTEQLKRTELEYTSICLGMVADNLGTPHLKSHMGVYALHIDLANRAASIPGTGDNLISFSYSYDVARFVDALLSMPKWGPETYCYSDSRTYNEVLAAAEEARGGIKFSVVYDDVAKLSRGEMTDLPFHNTIPNKKAMQVRWSSFGLMATKDVFYIPKEKSLNEVFPEIKTMTIEDIVGAWKGQE